MILSTKIEGGMRRAASDCWETGSIRRWWKPSYVRWHEN